MEVLDRTVNDLHNRDIGECSYFYEPMITNQSSHRGESRQGSKGFFNHLIVNDRDEDDIHDGHLFSGT